MTIDEEALGIVETVVTLAAKLKMNVVAEGIETPAQAAKLRSFNCDFGQGYLFSKPLPAATAMMMLMTSHDLEILAPLSARILEQNYAM
jgi:EAL domain-containing protein (putative c-di-GMP-specific phosphodiesterase class I)